MKKPCGFVVLEFTFPLTVHETCECVPECGKQDEMYPTTACQVEESAFKC